MNKLHSRRRVAIATILLGSVAIGIIGLPLYSSLRSSATLERRMSRFVTLLKAIAYYDQNNGRLPAAVKFDPDGVPLFSWRVAVLPFAEGVRELLDTDSPWNARSNEYFAQRPIGLFCDPDRSPQSERFRSEVVVIVGQSTPIQLDKSERLQDVPCDTVLIIEGAAIAPHWMAPGDISLADVNDRFVSSSNYDDIVVGFADGQVWCLDRSVPSDVLREFMTVEGTGMRDREEMLGPYKLAVQFASNVVRCLEPGPRHSTKR